jgi:hypothetical protein
VKHALRWIEALREALPQLGIILTQALLSGSSSCGHFLYIEIVA